MKIDDKIVNYEIGKYLSKPTPNETGKVDEKQSAGTQHIEGKEPSGQGVIVKLSNTSREVQLIREIISSEPDVRAGKVAELKERIESGRYEIDYEAVADKLVDELIDKL